jgi:AraC family transcriptional activator FtrA
LRAFEQAGTIVIPGWKIDEPPPPALIRALRRAHSDGARLVSICSGVFVLAATGLLDGKRVTAHWRHAERLIARYPNLHVEPDVLYVDEGNILTSAGSTAGIDLGLHIIRLDYGAEIANEIARRLVMPPHRDGGQAQYVRDSGRSPMEGGSRRCWRGRRSIWTNLCRWKISRGGPECRPARSRGDFASKPARRRISG